MECKSACIASATSQAIVIKIETYWNVNMNKVVNIVGKKYIKIETYWNVNKTKATFYTDGACIKIETYWNVNTNMISNKRVPVKN